MSQDFALWDPEVARQVRSVLEPYQEPAEDTPGPNRDHFLQRIFKTFEDLGGQDRFTFEMNKAYPFFAKNFLLRLVPNHHEVAVKGSLSVTIRPALPPSTLDGQFEDVVSHPATPTPPTPTSPPTLRLVKEPPHVES
jgi:hypothetical protein